MSLKFSGQLECGNIQMKCYVVVKNGLVSNNYIWEHQQQKGERRLSHMVSSFLAYPICLCHLAQIIFRCIYDTNIAILAILAATPIALPLPQPLCLCPIVTQPISCHQASGFAPAYRKDPVCPRQLTDPAPRAIQIPCHYRLQSF